ncbi:anti-sigma factor family protein [Paenibacillus turpanensis]|uniref:anti-sigma factor family protein n=1 Tax=Paenibacillus turpanensis TaxID=2689078 RepID=UPI00140A32B5|nr:hypothetical protein [Paenibacillus turpanensis]
MMCHEVMDLMQRNLDENLQDEEFEQLMSHIAGCCDCSDMYDRLQLLHSDLANLPKVVPAFSLVDAILPKLADLDMHVSPGSHEPAAAVEVKGGEAVQRNAVPLFKGKSGMALKWASGVAAACVAAVMLWQAGSPRSFESAEEYLPPAAAGETAANTSAADTSPAQAPQSPAADVFESAGQGQGIAALDPTATGSNDMLADAIMSVPKAAEPKQETGVQINNFEKKPSPPTGSARSTADGTTGGSGRLGKQEAAAAEKPKTGEQTGGDGEIARMMDAPPSNEGFGFAAGQEITIPSASSSDEGMLMAPVLAVPKQDSSKAAAGVPSQGITFDAAIIAVQEVDSPSGMLQATIQTAADSRFVEIRDRNGAAVFSSSYRWSASQTVTLRIWDGDTFKYTVKTGDKQRTFLINLKTGRETEVR